MIPTLHTERLALRAPRWDDFDAYAAFRASARSATVGGPFKRAEAFAQLSAILGHWSLRGFGRWMVADREADKPIGIVGLHYPEGWPEPEIAWSVFDGAEGLGIAQEAARASRNYAYATLGWKTLVSVVDPQNTRSVALAQRLNCTKEAPFRHEVYGALHIWRHPAPGALA